MTLDPAGVWIDLVALKRAVAINGINGLCITKLDILDGMPTLKMCIAYQYRGKRTEYAPLDAEGWNECEPVYLEFPGWQESTHGIDIKRPIQFARAGVFTQYRHHRVGQAARRRPRLPARAGRVVRLPDRDGIDRTGSRREYCVAGSLGIGRLRCVQRRPPLGGLLVLSHRQVDRP